MENFKCDFCQLAATRGSFIKCARCIRFAHRECITQLGLDKNGWQCQKCRLLPPKRKVEVVTPREAKDTSKKGYGRSSSYKNVGTKLLCSYCKKEVAFKHCCIRCAVSQAHPKCIREFGGMSDHTQWICPSCQPTVHISTSEPPQLACAPSQECCMCKDCIDGMAVYDGCICKGKYMWMLVQFKNLLNLAEDMKVDAAAKEESVQSQQLQSVQTAFNDVVVTETNRGSMPPSILRKIRNPNITDDEDLDGRKKAEYKEPLREFPKARKRDKAGATGPSRPSLGTTARSLVAIEEEQVRRALEASAREAMGRQRALAIRGTGDQAEHSRGSRGTDRKQKGPLIEEQQSTDED